MSNAIVTQPIAKLYKRCARKHHSKCEGRFQDYSVCSCECHTAGIVEGNARVTYLRDDAEWDAAVAEAQALVTAKPKTDTERAGYRVSGVTPLGIKPKSSSLPQQTSKPKALPRNLMGEAQCKVTEGFKPIGGSWKTYGCEPVKVTLRPDQRFAPSIFRKSTEA